MAKVDAGSAVNERPVSLAVLVATFLYRSDGCRSTFRYTIQRLAWVPAIRFQGALAVRVSNLAWVGFLGGSFIFA
jgi:hypothetical protein